MTKELSETNVSVVVEDGNHVHTDLDKLSRGKSLAYEELKNGINKYQPYEIMSLSIMASSKKATANNRQSCIYDLKL